MFNYFQLLTSRFYFLQISRFNFGSQSSLFKKWDYSRTPRASLKKGCKQPPRILIKDLIGREQNRRSLNELFDNSLSPSSESLWTSEALKGTDVSSLRKFQKVTTMNDGPGVQLRIMSYNVLSQGLLEKHHYLYRNQERYMLAWDYRKERILRDISSIAPDVFCLQEIEEKELPYFFKHLETLGYKSVFKMKTHQKGDGLGIYYRDPEIKLLGEHTVEFCQPGIIELETRDQVGLIAKFEKGGKEFFVANTHLLYNPRRTEVRLAQLQIFLAELQRFSRLGKDSNSRILFMGDLNSLPESPVIEFLTNGQLQSEYKPLPSHLGISPNTTHISDENMLFHSENKDKTKDGKSRLYASITPVKQDPQRYLISHPFQFKSAYDLSVSDKRGVTTHQDAWVMVDYMFYSNGFELFSRFTLPTSSESSQRLRFLPNNYFPSDHLLLAADFQII